MRIGLETGPIPKPPRGAAPRERCGTGHFLRRIVSRGTHTPPRFTFHQRYPWIGCECCKGTVWVPFKMIRERVPGLSSWTLDELAAKMKCDQCGKRAERYYPARQSDAPGFAKGY